MNPDTPPPEVWLIIGILIVVWYMILIAGVITGWW
ncbi:hypothetical protein LCGC14_0163930 [marine sediment metagenome]|uniref:Uncharacterized protein n=1 Tax=marine sediment metagenome TaxID=412755 RepID=A0A0F9UYF1_9ZZZZ